MPLVDLCELFFPDTPEYGRQFLKKLSNEGLLQNVKLGKRLAYCLSERGFALAYKSGKNAQAFALLEERLWEHSALVGSVGARHEGPSPWT